MSILQTLGEDNRENQLAQKRNFSRNWSIGVLHESLSLASDQFQLQMLRRIGERNLPELFGQDFNTDLLTYSRGVVCVARSLGCR